MIMRNLTKRMKQVFNVSGSLVLVSTFAIAGSVAAVPGAAVGPITSGFVHNFAENGTGTIVAVVAEDATGFNIVSNPDLGPDGAKFAIDTATGALTFLVSPNFEAPTDSNVNNIYVVLVRASGAVASESFQQISVTVTDANDSPIITSGATANFAENTAIATVVKDVNATDADAGASLTYSIRAVGDDAASLDSAEFARDATTGELTF